MTRLDDAGPSAPTEVIAKILAVDDRVENLTALAAVLEPLGQEVVTASSGAEALQCLLRDRFAVILMDVRMPSMSGFETASYVRQRAKTRHVPIIFLTAATEDADHVFRGYRAGAVDYIVKPFDPDVLRSKVAVFVELHQMQLEIERQGELLRERELQALARENEARYRFLAETIPQQVWEAAATGELVYTSRRMIDELGLDASGDAGGDTGDPLAGFLPVVDEDADDVLRSWNHSLRTGDPFQVEARLCSPAGDARWYLVQAVPYQAMDGSIARWVGSNTDIDDRKRHEIERAELYEAERTARASAEQRTRQARFLARVVGGLEEQNGFAARLDCLLGLCVPELADFATVESIRVDGRTEILASAHREPTAIDALREARTGQARSRPVPHLDRVLHGEDAVLTTGLPVMSGGDRPGPLDARSSIAGRIDTARGEPIALCLWRNDGRSAFADTDAELLRELTQRLGPVLENARLYDEQSRIFRVLQRSLLSGIGHDTPGVTFTVRYQPATFGMEIGGDWYDLFELASGEIAFAVGDVVGHGLAAASTMAKLRSAVRALAMTHDAPAALLEDLDHYVELTSEAHCTTLFYGVLHPETGRLRYASAGHPPALVVGADGTSVWLPDGRSAPLGVFGARRIDAETTLPMGSTIVAYSDGLVERRGEPLDAGFARLQEAAQRSCDQGTEEFADSIMNATVGDDGHGDDVALLCLRREAERDSVLLLRFPAVPSELRRLRRDLQSFLRRAGIDDPELGDAVLACNEAAANAVEHAYTATAEGDIVVEVRLLPDVIDMTVRDFGQWRRTTAATGGGRGMTLMRAVIEDLQVVTNRRGTMVRMRTPLRSARRHEAFA